MSICLVTVQEQPVPATFVTKAEQLRVCGGHVQAQGQCASHLVCPTPQQAPSHRQRWLYTHENCVSERHAQIGSAHVRGLLGKSEIKAT